MPTAGPPASSMAAGRAVLFVGSLFGCFERERMTAAEQREFRKLARAELRLAWDRHDRGNVVPLFGP
jgi:hypothetical protein